MGWELGVLERLGYISKRYKSSTIETDTSGHLFLTISWANNINQESESSGPFPPHEMLSTDSCLELGTGNMEMGFPRPHYEYMLNSQASKSPSCRTAALSWYPGSREPPSGKAREQGWEGEGGEAGQGEGTGRGAFVRR